MSFTEKLLFLLGLIMSLFGFLITAGGLVLFFDPAREESAAEMFIMVLLLGLLPLAGGVLLCWKMKNRGQHRRTEIQERAILQLAKDNQGCLTVADVALHLSLHSTQAKQLLDECHLNNLATLEVSESGVVLYRFKTP